MAVLTQELCVCVVCPSISNNLLTSPPTVFNRWFVFDTESKDLVTVHTDGNEQLSTMRYSPGLTSPIQLFKQKKMGGWGTENTILTSLAGTRSTMK